LFCYCKYTWLRCFLPTKLLILIWKKSLKLESAIFTIYVIKYMKFMNNWILWWNIPQCIQDTHADTVHYLTLLNHIWYLLLFFHNIQYRHSKYLYVMWYITINLICIKLNSWIHFVLIHNIIVMNSVRFFVDLIHNVVQ